MFENKFTRRQRRTFCCTNHFLGEETMSGTSDEVKGRVKKAVGELTGNDKLKREGEIDKVAGKVKQGVDKVKDTLQGKK